MKNILKASLLALFAFGGPLGVVACGDAPPAVEQHGTLSMALQSTSAAGDLYRLQNATFSISQGGGLVAQLSSDDDPVATSLSVDLAAGDYDVSLADGWVLGLVDSGGVVTPVSATLVSAQVQPVTIADNVTSNLVFTFKVDGEPVVLGGTLVISAQVVDACTEDTNEENDTMSQATPAPQASSVNGTICYQDPDWYQLNVGSAPLEIILGFEHAVGDLDMRLHGTGGVVATALSVTDNESIVYTPTPADQSGGLWLEVTGFNGAQNDYALWVGTSSGAAPASWTCPSQYYGSADGCDCGCGVVDPDCSGSCQFCNNVGSCSFTDCTAIDPNDSGVCL